MSENTNGKERERMPEKTGINTSGKCGETGDLIAIHRTLLHWLKHVAARKFININCLLLQQEPQKPLENVGKTGIKTSFKRETDAMASSSSKFNHSYT